MKCLKFLLAFTVLSIAEIPALAERVSSGESACNHISYLVTEEGRCIDLTSLTSQGSLINSSLSRKFFRTLRDKGVTITNESCKKERYGSYRTDRTLNLCENRIPLKERNAFYADQYLNTIAHESVHAIQHCIDTPNDSTPLTPIARYKPELWEKYVSILGYGGTQQVLQTYDDATNPHNDHVKRLEVEAWALAEKPEVVLDLLKKAC